jgi:tetratricopeptide (TPR) repeat protein
MRLTASRFKQTGIRVAVCVMAAITALASVCAHPQEPGNGAILKGFVRDSNGRPVADATVFLQLATTAQTPSVPSETTHTDSAGAYRFASLPEGAYVLRAEKKGDGSRGISSAVISSANIGRIALARKEMREVNLVLVSSQESESQNAPPATPTPAKPGAPSPEFFDEPQFTVAGVTQASNSGGHGSDTVLRTTEALAKATVSLSKESAAESSPPASAATESSLRDTVARNPKDPALHHQLGDVEEKLGNPLQAVREYQRAAELDPSESNLFDWGTELLAHRALEPASEVFARGHRQFPKSVPMLVALGVAWYARGSYDRAAEYLMNASDLAPENPTPYLFLGRMQSVQTTSSEGSTERLARFAKLQPDNALANYYYAVSLWKAAEKQSVQQPGGATNNNSDSERSASVESLLLKAVQLDPKSGAASLQLGIVYSQRADFSRAISSYQKAIAVSTGEASPESDETLAEAHYRLAQAYSRTGEKTKAQEELQLHANFAKKIKDDTERERREVQEFVISLRNKDSASQ